MRIISTDTKEDGPNRSDARGTVHQLLEALLKGAGVLSDVQVVSEDNRVPNRGGGGGEKVSFFFFF